MDSLYYSAGDQEMLQLYEQITHIAHNGDIPTITQRETHTSDDTTLTIRANTRWEALHLFNQAVALLEIQAPHEGLDPSVVTRIKELRQTITDTWEAHQPVSSKPAMATATHFLNRVRDGVFAIRGNDTMEVLERCGAVIFSEFMRGQMEPVTYLRARMYLDERVELLQVKKKSETLNQELIHDEVATHAWSRRIISEVVEDTLEASVEGHGVLVHFDVVGFGKFNNQVHYEYADNALRAIGNTLADEGIITARTGGDEFVCFFPDEDDMETCIQRIIQLCQPALAEIDGPFAEQNLPRFATLHVGLGAVVMHKGEKYGETTIKAVKRMQVAKQAPQAKGLRYPHFTGKQPTRILGMTPEGTPASAPIERRTMRTILERVKKFLKEIN